MSKWVPSDELVEKCETAEKAAIVENWDDNVINVRRLDRAAVRAALIAAVESGELVPRERLERVLDLDGDDWGSSQIGEPVYKLIEPAQPNGGGE